MIIWLVLVRAWRAVEVGAKWLWSRPVVLASAVGALVGAVVMVRSKANQVGRLKDALEVQRIKTAVARDEAKADALVGRADEHASEVEALRTQIVASKRRAVELASAIPLEGKTDDEIAKLFSDAGL